MKKLFLLLSITFAFTAFAQPATVWTENFTWPELKNQIQAGKTTILIPIGGTEQNGPDMALGKHNRRVQILAERIAERLGNALVAPVMAYVPEGEVTPPTEHMRFPGTITMPHATFQTVLEYAAMSYKQHGFRTIVFLGDHGSYQRDEQAVANKLNHAWSGSAVHVFAAPEYYQAATQQYPQLLKSKGYTPEEIGTHAGLSDTALLLAVDPRLVRATFATDKLTAKDGVYGDPHGATAELGQLGVDLIVNNTVAAIQKGIK